jgi:hypothetical protein
MKLGVKLVLVISVFNSTGILTSITFIPNSIFSIKEGSL